MFINDSVHSTAYSPPNINIWQVLKVERTRYALVVFSILLFKVNYCSVLYEHCGSLSGGKISVLHAWEKQVEYPLFIYLFYLRFLIIILPSFVTSFWGPVSGRGRYILRYISSLIVNISILFICSIFFARCYIGGFLSVELSYHLVNLNIITFGKLYILNTLIL